MLIWLDQMRKHAFQNSRDCGAIVYTMNDLGGKDEEDNAHANAIRAAIRKFRPDLTVCIATSADGKGKELIESFVEGEGDILIVKQMAGLGLDCSRLKVCLDLSATRTPASLIQRLMRIATPHNGIMTGIVVTPKDVLGDACFNLFIRNQGGETF